LGTRAEVVQIGTNIFFKPLKFRWGHTLLQFGLLPLTAFIKFLDNSKDETSGHEEHFLTAEASPKGFHELTPMRRVVVLLVGPTCTLLLGVGLLLLSVCLGGPQVNVKVPGDDVIAVSAVPGLTVAKQPATVAGQHALIRSTIGEFCLRFTTYGAMKGWGGPIAWIITCGYVGTVSTLAWVSCAALLIVANSALNLLPIPSMNGGYIVFAVWESIFGPFDEKLQLRLVLCGVLFIVAVFVYALFIDVCWFVEHLWA
jgi:membrane-associated protease RseP (regulator of RpoE activity)